MSEWSRVDDRLPDPGVVVLVYTPPQPEDWPGSVNIKFDFICADYEYWHDHSENYEHYMMVGGPNCCGPDVEVTGPSEKAKYTHWMPLPAPPGESP